MIDRLPQENWPGESTRSATPGEAPSFATPQRHAQRQPSPREMATPAFPQHFGMERAGVSNAPLFPPQILVIDDSITVRKIMEATLRRQGFSLQTFADGVEALQWLHKYPTVVPSLVYLDICMPRIDGYEIARALHSRHHLAAVPIVMLSGRDGVLDRVKGRLAGARGYITKPFRSEEILIETLRYLPASEAPWKNPHNDGGAFHHITSTL